MKKLVLFILLISSLNSQAQDYDSLRRVINQLTVEQNEIDLRLQRSHEQYSSGTLVMGLGLGAALIGSVLYASQPSDAGPMAPGLMIAGGAAAITGGIIQIDAHKWLVRRHRRK